ncbi:mitochondrial import inner membrane translocase subunit TIM44-2-like [Aristolochia californica]|uniref:mitochondrial import inner membrane translocase subunit TIM44-2-like n=1 Tax=Aristolochia californica TaxID=171875 RepID=UPI0035D6AA05
MVTWRICRTKQTTEQLYKHVDGVWTKAEAKERGYIPSGAIIGMHWLSWLYQCHAFSCNPCSLYLHFEPQVSANVKEKLSVSAVEVKETFGFGKQDNSDSPGITSHAEARGGRHSTTEPGNSQNTGLPAAIRIQPKVPKHLKDELSGKPNKRRRYPGPSASTSKEGTSTKTDMVVVPKKVSPWRKKWETLKEKMQGHPAYKRISGFSEPVVTKGQEIAEDVRERWETSDNPVVHKIQEYGSSSSSSYCLTCYLTFFNSMGLCVMSFSLPEFVTEVQEMIKPTVTAYLKATLTHCSREVIERCAAERKAYESNNISFDNKFQTQQIYCVRDRDGLVREGGQDTIHTVYYAWAMQQVAPEELGEGAYYPIWRLREMQQLGVRALI